jgi:ABC-2 type transport system permease protein
MNIPELNGQKADLQPAPAETISSARIFYWCLRRELWENRSIYLAPLLASALFVVIFAASLVHLPAQLQAAAAMPHMQQRAQVERPYLMASLLAMFVTFVVAIMYSVEAFQAERRDRSILFWKSLPVSDLTTVLAKVAIPLLVVPVVTFAVTAGLQLIMLLMSSARLMGSGMVSMLWSNASPARIWPYLFYHLMAIHALWYAPIYGWFMAVSSWAKRGAWVFAVLVPLVIGIAERAAFNTTHFAHLVQNHMLGDADPNAKPTGGMSMESMTPMSVTQFIMSPGLWMGLAVTAGFVAFAVRMRRYRGPGGL